MEGLETEELYDPRIGDIKETPTSYILIKNPTIPAIDRMAIQNDVIITWGSDDGVIKIKEIEYPKMHFSYDRMMAIQTNLIDCPFCHTGRDLSRFEGDKSGITRIFDPIFRGISSQWGLSTSFLSSIAGAFLYSQLGSLAIDYIFTPLGSLITKVVVGIILLIASILIKGRRDSSEKRLKEELYTAGLMFIGRALNLNDIELAKLELGQLNVPQIIAEKGILVGLGVVGANIIKSDVANYFIHTAPQQVELEEQPSTPSKYQFY